MANDSNKKFVEQLFNELMNSKNLSSVEKFIDPKFQHHGIPNAKGGINGFKDTLNNFLTAFPDFKLVTENFISEGDLVATRGYFTGTNKGSFMGAPVTGKKVRAEYIDVWKIKNGKAVENWVQMDSVGIMEQLGLVQAPEHA